MTSIIPLIAAALLLAPARSFAQTEVPSFEASEARSLSNFDPQSIRRDDGKLLVEGFLDRTFTLSARIAPQGVEVRTKHFLHPAGEWRKASFGEVLGLRAALKRRADRVGAAAADRPLYLEACRVLQAVQPSAEELGRVQAQLEAFLVRPFVPHEGVRVSSVGLHKGKVVVEVESGGELARARELVEKSFPDYAPFVEYRVSVESAPRE